MSTREVLDWRAAGLFRLGEEAQAAERYLPASRYYEAALRIVEDHEPARFNLGVTELRRGHAKRAAELFSSLLGALPVPQRMPSHQLPTAFNLALAHACAGNGRDAYKVARAVVLAALAPSQAEGRPAPLRGRIEGPAVALFALVATPPPGERAPSRPGERVDAPSREELVKRVRHDAEPDARTAALAAEFARDASAHEPRTQYLLACYDALKDASELALDELEDALAGDPGSIEWARRDPLLEPLRAADRREFRSVIRWARAGRSARPASSGERSSRGA